MVQQVTPAARRGIFGSELLANPYPFYHLLRSADPVHWAEAYGGWVLTRYEDVTALLRSPHVSSERSQRARAYADPEFAPYFAQRAHAMLNADAPRHTRLRLLVNKAFTPATVETLAPFIRRVVVEALDAGRARSQMDVIREVAYPLPASVIAELLGVPREDRDRFKQWSDDTTAATGNLPSDLPLEVMRKAALGMQELRNYFAGIVARRRAEPRDDLISALVRAHEQADCLSEEELLANAVLLLNAGHETTTNLIGNGTLALLRHPDQMRRLIDDPSLVPTAVEEFLRYDSPVQFTTRILKEDITLGGKVLKAGQAVVLVQGAANRDPAHFPDPDRLAVGRADNKHVAFGLGSHFCLGAPLARLEERIVFEEIVRRVPGMHLDGPAPEYRANFNLRGLKSLDVAF
jgi:cytochrome P450